MTDTTLKERLDALSEKATPGQWGQFSPTAGPFQELAQAARKAGNLEIWDSSHDVSALLPAPVSKPYRIARFKHADVAAFVETLVNAYRSGNLVTKEDLEAAVAKAVADEREACAGIADQVDVESSQLTAEGPITKTAIRAFRATAFGIAKQIRARGEGE
jgi:hypothetical protein